MLDQENTSQNMWYKSSVPGVNVALTSSVEICHLREEGEFFILLLQLGVCTILPNAVHSVFPCDGFLGLHLQSPCLRESLAASLVCHHSDRELPGFVQHHPEFISLEPGIGLPVLSAYLACLRP